MIVEFPLTPAKTALFLNGSRRTASSLKRLVGNYEYIVAVDGAYNTFTVDDLADSIDVVLGDGDSITDMATMTNGGDKRFVELANQDYTDFEKSLRYVIEGNVLELDIYWGSGGEMDHFLGNLSVAAKYAEYINCRFYDDRQCYFYLSEDCRIEGARGHQMSIYPFPKALISSTGLRYDMDNVLLKQDSQQSLRNVINSDVSTISIHGNAFVFINLALD